MPPVIPTIVFFLFLLAVCGLLAHTLAFFYLLLLFRRSKQMPSETRSPDTGGPPPLQLVQLPVYNEDPEMVRALVDSACALRYPRDRLCIQVLDDSDREEISRRIIEHVEKQKAAEPALDIIYLHRSVRTGYKAGNLNHGLEAGRKALREKYENDPDRFIVSIFDADFIIPEEYLRRTVPCFADPDVCAVQARIRYLNADENALTRMQSAYLTNLHLIDFASRSHSGNMTTFLGSAGSWRVSAIESLGGWTSHTQIEDVDLSIAAQLAGWKILYLDDFPVWSRLPDSYIGFKLQQRSWMKGLMEVCRKHLGAILKNREISPFRRAMALELFLVLPFQPLYMIAIHLLALPVYFHLAGLGVADRAGPVAIALALLLNATHIPFLRSPIADRAMPETPRRPAYRTLAKLGTSICIALGMFVVFSYGLIEGLLGRGVHRDSTQKGNPGGATRRCLTSPQRTILGRLAAAELIAASYSVFVACWAISLGEWGLLLLYAPFSVAYPWVALHSLAEIRFGRRDAGHADSPGGR